jgi:hypothetical protein
MTVQAYSKYLVFIIQIYKKGKREVSRRKANNVHLLPSNQSGTEYYLCIKA